MGIKVCPERNRHGEPPSFATLNQTCLKPTRPNRVTPSGTWYQSLVAGAVRLEPAPHGAALAVLLVVTVLRPDELRRERDHLGTARGHEGGAQQGVEGLGRLAFSGAGGAVPTVDLGGAVVLGAVQRDQQV